MPTFIRAHIPKVMKKSTLQERMNSAGAIGLHSEGENSMTREEALKKLGLPSEIGKGKEEEKNKENKEQDTISKKIKKGQQ